MGWQSSDVVRFDLESLLLNQTRISKLKSAYNLLIIGLQVCNEKPTKRKSWTGNLVMLSDLTLG